MAQTLHEIVIRGLHNSMDITIPVLDNKLVLVGVNGLGKTTVVNILYYVLSQQWNRLLDINFDEILIRVGRRKIKITHEMIVPSKQAIMRISHTFPSVIRQRIKNNSRFYNLITKGDFGKLEDEFNIPKRYLERAYFRMREIRDQAQLFDENESNSLTNVGEALSTAFPARVMYLPTYRRIEQDLTSLLPHFEEDVRDAISRQLHRQKRERSFVELVQFGMEDVESRISRRMILLKEQARVELSGLAGHYLRDIIRGDAELYSKNEIKKLTENDVERILDRVEERTLRLDDKARLRAVIENIRNDSDHEETTQEKYLAHFFSKLVTVQQSQRIRETPLRDFSRICSEYLEEKTVVFNDVDFSLRIVSDNGLEIKMGDLSSGEKQIFSLFSQIYLGETGSIFMIIDEPELSLSVDWQKRLLPDISRSEKCDFLVAVTHSPFVFDNEFEPYVVDLRTCINFR